MDRLTAGWLAGWLTAGDGGIVCAALVTATAAELQQEQERHEDTCAELRAKLAGVEEQRKQDLLKAKLKAASLQQEHALAAQREQEVALSEARTQHEAALSAEQQRAAAHLETEQGAVRNRAHPHAQAHGRRCLRPLTQPPLWSHSLHTCHYRGSHARTRHAWQAAAQAAVERERLAGVHAVELQRLSGVHRPLRPLWRPF
jgi:hypothetical protein